MTSKEMADMLRNINNNSAHVPQEEVNKYKNIGVQVISHSQSDALLSAVELLEADKEGPLVRLPVACGQTVYCVEGKRIFQNKVKDVLLNESGAYRFTVIGDCYTPTVKSIEQIGKTVFLTRTEAEAALEREEHK